MTTVGVALVVAEMLPRPSVDVIELANFSRLAHTAACGQLSLWRCDFHDLCRLGTEALLSDTVAWTLRNFSGVAILAEPCVALVLLDTSSTTPEEVRVKHEKNRGVGSDTTHPKKWIQWLPFEGCFW